MNREGGILLISHRHNIFQGGDYGFLRGKIQERGDKGV